MNEVKKKGQGAQNTWGGAGARPYSEGGCQEVVNCGVLFHPALTVSSIPEKG